MQIINHISFGAKIGRRIGLGLGAGINRRAGLGLGAGINRRAGLGFGAQIDRRAGLGLGTGINRRAGLGLGSGIDRRAGLLFIITLLCAWSMSACGTQTARAQSVLYAESFDGVAEPDLPPGITASGSGWKTNTASSSPGSGGNNLSHSSTEFGSIEIGPFDFSAVLSGSLSYLARRTDSYPVDSLVVSASTDGGAFEIMVIGMGEGLPENDKSWKLISVSLPAVLAGASDVRFRLDAWGGSASSANMRLDDVSIEVELDADGIQSAFGFESDTTRVAPPDTAFAVGIDISWPGTDAIQGIQYDISWDPALLAFRSVDRGAAIASVEDWTLDIHAESDSVRIVLLGAEGASLPAGIHSGLMSATFDIVSPEIPGMTEIQLSGALFAADAPDGHDVPISGGSRDHTVSIDGTQSSISLDTDSLDFGVVTVGASQALSVTVANESDVVDLEVTSIVSSEAVFTVESGSVMVGPGQEETLEVAFAPSPTHFGLQEGVVVLHYGPAGGPAGGSSNDSTIVNVTGIGTGGRGDTDGDGLVDVADILFGLDAVLGAEPLTATLLARADVFPFPAGDGNLDVRDLTVHVQAVLADAWPDAESLPEAAPGDESSEPGMGAPADPDLMVNLMGGADRSDAAGRYAAAGQLDAAGRYAAAEQLAAVSDSGVEILLEPFPGGTRIILSTPDPLRGVQLAFRDRGGSAISADARSEPVLSGQSAASSFARVNQNPTTGITRLLLARVLKDAIPSGETVLLESGSALGTGDILESVAVGLDRRKRTVSVRRIGSTDVDPLPETPVESRLDATVYPNPFIPGIHPALHMVLSRAGTCRIGLYDVAGRLLQRSDASERATRFLIPVSAGALAPGLILARAVCEKGTTTASVVVVR